LTELATASSRRGVRLSRSRARLPLEVHERVFAWALERLAERGLVKGERIGMVGDPIAPPEPEEILPAPRRAPAGGPSLGRFAIRLAPTLVLARPGAM
jgi:hypothetical protein